jgi:selenocysteine lyase/cysteine desulfurase
MRGAVWTAPDELSLVEDARRFEDWEFPYALVLGLGAAVEYAQSIGVLRAGERAVALASHLRRRLMSIESARLLDRGRHPCAIVTTDIAGQDSTQVVAELRRRHINASVSLAWYGLIDMTEKSARSAIRLSPHYYNTLEEIDTAVETLREIVKP